MANNWKEGYTIEGAPEWWRGLLPTRFTPISTQKTIYNALIPFLSPEDQRTVAVGLSQMDKNAKKGKAWKQYNPELTEFPAPPVEITPETMEQFTSADRAQRALDTLDKITALSKKEKIGGAGYKFLRQLLATMKDFGGGSVGAGNRQTRAQYQQMQSALDPILAQMKDTPYAGIAQRLAAPFFSAGKAVPISKDASGRYVFGEPNKQLFG